MRDEWVVLVDEEDREVGRARKAAVHHGETPLHRAFSAFLFDPAGRLLLQRRAAAKVTWPLVWSNSCCGHPAPGEATLAAVERRVREELGAVPDELWVALPRFRYRAEHDGVVENEICPVVAGHLDPASLAPDGAEVAAVRWADWAEFLDEIGRGDGDYSPWCREEALRLGRLDRFRAWHERRSPVAARRDS